MNTLYWWNAKYMWKEGITAKQRYEGAKFITYFGELAKVHPLHVVQKRKGF